MYSDRMPVKLQYLVMMNTRKPGAAAKPHSVYLLHRVQTVDLDSHLDHIGKGILVGLMGSHALAQLMRRLKDGLGQMKKR